MRFFDESTSLLDRTEYISFALVDLYAFLGGVRNSGHGVPLLDWLTENAGEFAPYINSAGWLPRDECEWGEVREQREADRKAVEAAPLAFGYTDDEDDSGHSWLADEEAEDCDVVEDRWR